jgi:hypothetical protein
MRGGLSAVQGLIAEASLNFAFQPHGDTITAPGLAEKSAVYGDPVTAWGRCSGGR